MIKSAIFFIGIKFLALSLFLTTVSELKAQQQEQVSGSQFLRASQVSLVLTHEQLTSELISAVAKLGLSWREQLNAEIDLLTVIAARCGKANVVGPYLAHFVAVNSDIEEIKNGKFILQNSHEIVFPACIPIDYVTIPTNVPVTQRGGPAFERAAPIIESNSLITYQVDKGVLSSVNSGSDYAKKYDIEVQDETSTIESILFASNRLNDPVLKKTLDSWLDVGQRVAEVINHLDPEEKSVKEIARIVSNNISEDSDKHWQKAQRATATQDLLLVNPDLAFNKLQAITRFELSAIPKQQAVTFYLAPDVAPDVAASKFMKLSNSEIKLMGALEPIFSFSQSGNVCESSSKENITDAQWPIHVDQLTRILKLNEIMFRTSRKFQRVGFGKILIFDTGFPHEEIGRQPFDASEFVINGRSERLIQHAPIYEKFKYVLDFIGTNSDGEIIQEKIANSFDKNAKQAGHGIAVATLALGGIGFLQQDSSDNRQSLLNSQGGKVIVVRGYAFNNNGFFTSTPVAINEVLKETGWRDTQPAVVNLSLKYLNSIGISFIENSTANEDKVVFVIAAGNRGKDEKEANDIGDEPILPAIFGGQRSPNVITVGAHDIKGNPSIDSNYSTVHVDIAAPGCDVPVYYWDHENQKIIKTIQSGTSLAAPLVSFTIAILHSNGLNPHESKRRILGSADFHKSWENKSTTSAVLNIPKAVATHFDVIETTSNELLFGNINWHPIDGEFVCGRKLQRDALLKLSVSEYKDNLISVKLMRQNHLLPAISNFWYRECELKKPSDKHELTTLLGNFKEAILVDNQIQWIPRRVEISKIRDITLCASKHCIQPPVQ